jgi:hypothetical protein
MRASDHIVKDLSSKVADDASATIERSARLLWHPDDMCCLALSATAAALGLAAGFLHCGAGKETTPDELADGIWQQLRPMVLKSAMDGIARRCAEAVKQ